MITVRIKYVHRLKCDVENRYRLEYISGSDSWKDHVERTEVFGEKPNKWFTY